MNGPYLAVDLGAESGRAVVGTLTDAGALHTREILRFPNRIVAAEGRLRWQFQALYRSCLDAMTVAARLPQPPVSVGIDGWGVDFALLDADGRIIGEPQSYRDPDGRSGLEAYRARWSLATLYRLTGVQVLPINTLFQLAGRTARRDEELRAACSLLFIPGAIDYLLCGERRAERTIASTSQLLDGRSGDWSAPLLARAGVEADLMPPLIDAGETIGALRGVVAEQTGLDDALVVAVGAHDTASAVAAVPAEGGDFAYVSSGTWSLVGIERDRPLITPGSRAANLTNEGGVGGRVRVLRNVTGLWLLAECRRAWSRQRSWSYEDLESLAAAEPSLTHLIDPDHPFDPTADMPSQIAGLCRRTGQDVPVTEGQFARCILDSLALAYRRALEAIVGASGRRVRRLHIVGGGARNRLLCQSAANATGLEVLAGPEDASATGNILVQAVADGSLRDLDEAREVVRRSADVRRYEPVDPTLWADAAARYGRLFGRQAAPEALE